MTMDTRRFVRLFCCLLLFGHAAWAADPAKTLIQDTLYRADGSPAAGTLVVSWPAFVTADGKSVAAGSLSVKIRDGAVNLPLVPTQGATPAGTYYKVIFTLDNGASSQEYWSVPSNSPTSISAIRSSVVPATVALQVVSREYVDSAIAAAAGTPSNPLALNKGGTGQSSWTSGRCVRVAEGGTRLETAPSDCSVATSNADMVDGQHASSFQATLANAASLSKIGEDGGNPLWNGGAWPGGGSSNATQIQGKAVDNPNAAGQQLTYNGTKFAAQAPVFIDPRNFTVGGVNYTIDCTGTTDSYAALNALFNNMSGRKVMLPLGSDCTARTNSQIVVFGQTSFYIDGGSPTGGVGFTLWGCLAAGTSVLKFNRSGNGVIKGLMIRNVGPYCSSTATTGIEVTNTGGGGYTGTSLTFQDNSFFGYGVAANYIGLSIAGIPNLEDMKIRGNHFSCYGSNSTGLYISGGNSEGNIVEENNIGNCYYGIWQSAGSKIRNNTFGYNGSYSTFGAGGAAIHIQSCLTSQYIGWNKGTEGTGVFLDVAAAAGCYLTFEGNDFATNDIAPSTSAIYVSGPMTTLRNNRFNTYAAPNLPSNAPLIGTHDSLSSHGALMSLMDDGTNRWAWTSGTFTGLFDSRAFQYASKYPALAETQPTEERNYDLRLAPPDTSYGQPSRLIFRSWAGAWDDYVLANMPEGFGASDFSSLLLYHPTGVSNSNIGVTAQPPFMGGLATKVAAMSSNLTYAWHGTAGSTHYTYQLVGLSGAGTVALGPSVTVTNGAAVLNSTDYPALASTYSPGFYAYYVCRTASSGTPSSTGIIGTVYVTDKTNWAFAGVPQMQFSDTGLAANGACPTVGTADGSINLALGAKLKMNGVPITNSTLVRWPWTASSTAVTGGGSVANVIDGDTTTYWNAIGTTADLVIDTGRVQPIAGLTYTPYSVGYRVLNYSVALSSDGTTYGSAVATGTFANDNTAKVVTWAATNSRYVKFSILSSGDGNANPAVAEMSIDVVQNIDADEVDGRHASDFLAATTVLPATKTSASQKWLASYDATTGAFAQTRPAFTDISGSVAASQLPTPTASALGGVKSLTCTGTDKVSAIGTDGVPVCSADQIGGAGGGITALNTLSAATQTFAKVDDTNVTLSIGSATSTHTFTLGWTGTLGKARGGTGADMSGVTFPSSGTLAVTTDLPGNEPGATNNFLTGYNSATHAFSKTQPIWANIDKTTSSLADLATRSAGDLSSGTLPAARLPKPTTSALGGVYMSADCSAGQHVSSVNTSTGALTCSADSGGGGSGAISNGATNAIPKYTAATTLDDSLLSDDGTTLSYSGTGGIAVPQLATSGTGAGTVYLKQGTAASLGTTSVGFTAPPSVSSYNLLFPGAAGSGLLTWSNAANVVTGTFTSVLGSALGGTANGFTKFSGPTTAEKTFTLPDASATILTSNAAVTVAQGGTGLGTLTTHALYAGNATTSPSAITVPSADSLLYGTTGADPLFKALPTTGTNGCSGSGDALQWNNSTHAFACITGLGAGGSGTVNSGTASHIAYYATSTGAVSDMGADFTFGTHTLSGGASSILDLSASAATAGLKIPTTAGGAPTVDGQIAVNSTTHNLVFGSNGATAVASRTIAAGSSAMGTSSIASAACATAVTTSATGTATTDVVWWGFNGDPTGVTGYAPATTGMLTIIAYPTADNVNFKVCNNTSAAITPGAITLNWRIVR
ncbi:MAG: discoidin domain-containing protein [Acidobacteriia bacterium]|nr:discoidin domain-containing protein [Terriglobia bacterium]